MRNGRAQVFACSVLAIAVAGTLVGCDSSSPSARMRIPDEELDPLRISILWEGIRDVPAPGVHLVCGKPKIPDRDPTDILERTLRPLVVIDKKEARAILDVVIPIIDERRTIDPARGGYVVTVQSVRTRLEGTLGSDPALQAESLKAISSVLDDEGQAAISLLVDDVSRWLRRKNSP